MDGPQKTAGDSRRISTFSEAMAGRVTTIEEPWPYQEIIEITFEDNREEVQ